MYMAVTERQKEILNTIIDEYIKSPQPVSSRLVEKKYNFGICPATIRIEMQKLTDAGFLHQPHTSAGRIPTDKGYRFFVNSLFEEKFFSEEFNSEIERWFEERFKDTFRFLQSLTKNLSALSSNLALGYLSNEKIFWKEGWDKVFQEPEFRERKLINDFFNLLTNFEECIEDFEINSEIKVYIGKENPFSKTKEFSTIITSCHFPKEEKGILAILGPKRMTYERNIGSLNSLTRFLERL